MKKLFAGIVGAAAVAATGAASAADISTAEAFVNAMANDPTGSHTLTADIDMTGVEYTRPTCFSGWLDGQGHTILGLSKQFCLTNAGTIVSVTFDGTVSGANTKFAGEIVDSKSGITKSVGAISIYANNSSYSNVVVKGYSLSVGRSNSGFFTGEAVGCLTFVGCATDSSCMILQGSNNNNNNGGFIGKITGITAADTIFNCCTNNAEMAKKGDANNSQATAGFVAFAKGGNLTAEGYPALRFVKCVNNGSITANGGNGNMSGFVGMTEIGTAAYNTGTFRIVLVDCVNNGNLDAQSYAVASACGFIAQLGGGVTFALTNCVNRGNIGGETSARSVGFVGWMANNICTKEDAKSVFVNCANYGTIAGVRSAGIFGGGGTASGARNANVPGIYNCANYGTITGSTYAGEFVGLAPQYFSLLLDNCYSATGNYCGNVEGTYATNNMHGPYEVDYDATAACESLAARAELYGWDKWWKVGKASGKPELTQWSGDVYVICRVRYLDWDGTVLKVRDVAQGDPDFAPGKPSRAGYVFTGWDKSTECVMTDMDVSAQYRERLAGEIDCVADFISDMADNPSGAYVLTADLDFTGSGYTTFSSFSGLLDGKGHTLSGVGAQQLFDTVTGAIVDLTLDGATLSGPTSLSAQGVGVFCNTADGAAFTNVVVRGYRLRHLGDAKADYIGLFASSAKGGVEFVCCETGDDSSVGQADKQRNCGQGGFVGKVVTSTDVGIIASFIDCTNRAEIIYEANNGTDIWGSGGIVGTVSVGSSGGVAEARFTRCVNFGTVNGSQCGGIVGYVPTASTPGKVRFENCVNCGAFGSKVLNAGGVVGKQAQTANTGIQMIFVNCVNYHSIKTASGSAGGIVGWMQGARNNSAMGKMFFTNCANYAEISVAGRAGGIVGCAMDSGAWGGSIDAIVCNCANYGAITGSSAGDIIGKLGPSSSANSSTKGHVDNCFGVSTNAVGVYEGCAEVSITNVKSSADEGYSPAAAKKALNDVAKEKGYGEWTLGKWPGDVLVPELVPFCANPYTAGLIFFIGGTPLVSPAPTLPPAQPDGPEEPPPGDSPAVAEQLLNLTPAPSGGRFAVPADRVWPAEVGKPDVCLWHDDRFGACAITIDDNCRPDHAWWRALSDELGIRLTWFVITDNVEAQGTREGTFQGNWAEWQQLADAGHSVQSHTTNHKSGADLTEDELAHMYKDSLDAINAHITNNVACCIAYPSGDAHPDVLAKYAIAARGVYGMPSAANTIDYLCTNKGGGGKGHVQIVAFGETQEEPKWIQGKKNLARGLNVVLYHYVHSGSTDAEREANAANAEAEVRYIASLKDDRLWVCRFDDVMKYAQERDSATLTVTENTAQKIAFDLADRMKDELFDFPLTVKVRLPDGWKGVKATQGGKPVEAKFVMHEGAPYALVKAVPDRGTVSLAASE